MSTLYYCTREDNTCPKREECKRYVDAENHSFHTTLFKTSCVESNDYVLFIKKDGES